MRECSSIAPSLHPQYPDPLDSLHYQEADTVQLERAAETGLSSQNRRHVRRQRAVRNPALLSVGIKRAIENAASDFLSVAFSTAMGCHGHSPSSQGFSPTESLFLRRIQS